MIKRKELVPSEKPKETPPTTAVKVKRSTNVKALPDAIVDGVLQGDIGSQIYVELYRDGMNVMTLCELLRLDDDGCMHLWNKTLEQWTLLNVKNPPSVFKLKKK